jgi:hypothetical protein
MQNSINKLIYTASLYISVLGIGCTKFVSISPPITEIGGKSVFTSDATANSSVTGLYSLMMQSPAGSFANYRVTLFCGLAADEFDNYSTDVSLSEFYKNSITIANSSNQGLWTDAYSYIYQCNSVIEGLTASTAITLSLKKQLIGEVMFVRAFCYFYLTNLYGNVPLVITSDYVKNASIVNSSQTSVYRQIISDLVSSKDSLPSDYASYNNERTRPTASAAIALLARVYLFTGDWKDAEAEASLLVENNTLYQLSDSLNEVFLANSSEAIWQLKPEVPGYNTWEGFQLIPIDAIQNVAVTTVLLNSFEIGDSRKQDWLNNIVVGSDTLYYPFKYKVKNDPNLTEYYMMLRLSEQYLIRAEARAQQLELADAINDINKIRERAILPDLPANLIQKDVLAAIYQERRIEFFSEWGHRWLDLKRLNQANSFLKLEKALTWEATDTLFPIPLTQILNDPNIKQNAGY